MRCHWEQIQIGDRVRVTGWPPEFSRERLHEETIAFYEYLIESEAVLDVVRKDDFGIPYGELHIVQVDGSECWHEVGLNHGCVEVVDAKGRE